MINLEKELVKNSSKQRKKEDNMFSVESVKGLLELKSAEDFHILNEMGLAGDLKLVQNRKGEILERQRIEEQYGKVFTLTEIRGLASTFALKMLPTYLFKEKVDPVILQKIREFKEQNNMSPEQLGLDRKFFFLAAPGCFKLESLKEGDTYKERFNTAKEKFANRIARIIAELEDPILFYQIDDEHYRMMHKFGRDLTSWRRFMGWKYHSQENYMTLWFVLCFLTMSVPLNIVGHPVLGTIFGVAMGVLGVLWRMKDKAYPFHAWTETTISGKEFWMNKYKAKL